MDNLQIFIILMFAAVILVGIAQKIRISYPIALIIGGATLGFIPNLPPITFDPNLILKIVLPPILYYAAFGISFREFKRNWREIFSLALGLVVVTTLVVGVIFKWFFPEYPWALAFAFGAIVSPPDAVSATTILKQFAIGPRLLAVLEGESLINDASALVLYKIAVTALLSGVFSLADGSLEFVKVVSGGIFLGFILGILIQNFSRMFLEPVVGVVFSFTIPYVTYMLADYLGVSGVLAVVVNGLIGSNILHKHHSSLRRVVGYATWDIFIILMNCFVFILIGLQLRAITETMSPHQLILYAGYALLFTLVMIAVRMMWVYAKHAMAYLRALNKPHSIMHCSQILSESAILGWAGMRGIVSLTAALALPYVVANGSPLEGRNEVIFLTFICILLSLLVPGFTLAPLIRWLNIGYYEEPHEIAHHARKQLAKIATDKTNHFHVEGLITDKEYEFLSSYFYFQRKVFEISTSRQKKFQHLESLRLKVIKAQHDHLLNMWEKQEVDDRLLTSLEHELDVGEVHKARAEIN